MLTTSVPRRTRETHPTPDAAPATWRDYFADAWLPAGLIVFAAKPNPRWTPGDRREFAWPSGWQRFTPRDAAARLAQWRPGWCLALVTGHGLDGIDLDPRPGNGLDVDAEWERLAACAVPVFGWNETPSGGVHALVPSTGYAATANPAIGLDYRGGLARPAAHPANTGRSLLYLPGTMRPKYRDTPGPHYRGHELPDLAAVTEWVREFPHQSRDRVAGFYAAHGMTLTDSTGAAAPATAAQGARPVPLRPGDIPRWLAEALTDPGPFADRSGRFHRLVSACRQGGLDQETTTQLMGAWDARNGAKYGHRVSTEVARCWPKVEPDDAPRSWQRGTARQPWHRKEGAWA